MKGFFMGSRFSSRVGRRTALLSTILAVALVATACSNPNSDGVASEAAVSQGTKLSQVSLATTDIEELDVVRFLGLDVDGDLSDLELHLIADGMDPIETVLFADDVSVFAIAPFHPVTPGSGGPLRIQLSAGAGELREFDVVLAGIPAAPGAWDEAIATMLSEFESRADQLGTSLSQLSDSEMSDLGDDAAVLKFLTGFIDDGTDGDIGSLPTRPGEELSAEQVALLDALVAKLGLGRMNLPPLDIDPATAMQANAGTSTRELASRATAIRAGFAQARNCRVKVIDINNGDDLKRELAKGIAAQNALKDGFFSDSSDYIVSNSLVITGVAAGAFAATGVGAPAAGVVAGVSTAAGAMYATQRLALLADASNHPTRFTSLDVAVDSPEMNEDFTKDGQVTKVDVVAASMGFNGADALAGLGAAVADGALGLGVGKLVAGRSAEVLGGTMGMSEPLRQTAQGKALSAAGSGLLEFCGQQWTVSINDKKYVRAWTVDGNIAVDESTFSYRPLRVGTDTLWIETLPSAFPGASAISSAAIETVRLEVLGEPLVIKVEKAGDIVDIEAILQGADTLTLAWEAEQGEWKDGMTNVTDSRETSRRLQTPSNRDLYPFKVTMTSLSTTGLRSEATDDRFAEVIVKIRDLIVTPDPGGVLVRKTLQFTAKDNEGRPLDVKWTATGGQIDDSGLYTAGDVPGQYTVTATAKNDEQMTDTVTVTVIDKCLIGTWRLRSQDFFDQIAGPQGTGIMKYRSGEHFVTIREDGTFLGSRVAWSFEAVGEGGKVIGTIDAENPGTWMATDTELFLVESPGATENVEMFIEVNGNLVSIPGLDSQFSFTSEGYAGQAAYTCDADVMTSTSNGVTSVLDRDDG
ncbi:MAG: hypothetical protein M5U23_05195 [Acidimicrobiia bacterium]|nr:hypothetical protein [Acidimicrobiia bacterium]